MPGAVASADSLASPDTTGSSIDLLPAQLLVEEQTEFSGPVTANLRFSCNEIDSYVVSRLGRVDTSGAYHLLFLGTISPARRRIDDARSTATEVAIDVSSPEPLVPGEPVVLRFSPTPHPVVIRKGERLRFDVGSRTDLLRSDVSHGHAQFEMHVPPYFSRNTLHHGAETYLELHKDTPPRSTKGTIRPGSVAEETQREKERHIGESQVQEAPEPTESAGVQAERFRPYVERASRSPVC